MPPIEPVIVAAEKLAVAAKPLADDAIALFVQATQDSKIAAAMKGGGEAASHPYLKPGEELAPEVAKFLGCAPKAPAKFAPSYAREGTLPVLTTTKVDRIRSYNIITSSEAEAPVIKLFPKEPPQITIPASLPSHKRADVLLTADYANMIHWDDAARAAVSKFERPSATVSKQFTTIASTPEQMEQMAISGAADYISRLPGNSFTEFLAKRCGPFTFERRYNARTALQSI